MNDKMETAVRSVLKLDPEFDPIRADEAIQVLKGRSLASMRAVEKLDHVVSRAQAAIDLRVDVHSIDAFVRKGKLRRIMGTGSRALGISAISLKAYTEERQMEAMRKAAAQEKRQRRGR